LKKGIYPVEPKKCLWCIGGAWVVPTYKIREWDETPVKGTFYEADLQKVHVSNEALFRIEKVLKRQKGQVLVKWKGWPDKYNSWISHRDVTTLKKKT